MATAKIAWIETVEPEKADGVLRALYDRVTTPHGTVDNVMKAHSLRPHTMGGHLALYRSVLHNEDNTLPFWFLELVACVTSITNDCAYSLAHHGANAMRLMVKEGITGPEGAQRVLESLKIGRPEDHFEFGGKHYALLQYARKLTGDVGSMVEADIERLREAGATDGEILEVNQVCAYFNYSNRLLNGLGVTTDGDVIGYYAEEGA